MRLVAKKDQGRPQARGWITLWNYNKPKNDVKDRDTLLVPAQHH